MKEVKNKVGRPKLADEKTKKTAIYMCVACLIFIIGIIIAAVYTISGGSFKNILGEATNSYFMNHDFTYFSQKESPQDMIQFCGRTDYKRRSKRPDHYPTIETSGCGVTSAAMVLNNLVSKDITPKVTMKEAYKAGYCGSGIDGTSNKYYKYMANKHNLKYTALSRNSKGIEKAKEILRNGGLLIASVNSRSGMTTGSHYVVIYKISKNNNVYVANPNKYLNNSKNTLAVNSLKKPYKLESFVNNGWINSGWWGFERKKNAVYETPMLINGKIDKNMTCPEGYVKCNDQTKCLCRKKVASEGKTADEKCKNGYAEGSGYCYKIVEPDGSCPMNYTACSGNKCECKQKTKSSFKDAASCKKAIKKADGYDHSLYINGVCYRTAKKSTTCPIGSVNCISNKCTCKKPEKYSDKAIECVEGYVQIDNKCYKTHQMVKKK